VKYSLPVNGGQRKKFGQQTPRRWGWGTPLKKRTATRTKSILHLRTLWRFVNG
jgi:hypothetical protein